MTTTKEFRLTKDDIRLAILNYISEHCFVDTFEITTIDGENNIIRINMNEGIRANDIDCLVKVRETK